MPREHSTSSEPPSAWGINSINSSLTFNTGPSNDIAFSTLHLLPSLPSTKLLDGNIRPGTLGALSVELPAHVAAAFRPPAFSWARWDSNPQPPARQRSNPVLHHVQPRRKFSASATSSSLCSLRPPSPLCKLFIFPFLEVAQTSVCALHHGANRRLSAIRAGKSSREE